MPLFIDQETWFQVQQYVFVNNVVGFFLKSVAKLDTEQIWLARTSIRAIVNNIKTGILFTHWNQQLLQSSRNVLRGEYHSMHNTIPTSD